MNNNPTGINQYTKGLHGAAKKSPPNSVRTNPEARKGLAQAIRNIRKGTNKDLSAIKIAADNTRARNFSKEMARSRSKQAKKK